jgi:hypothetical protein
MNGIGPGQMWVREMAASGCVTLPQTGSDKSQSSGPIHWIVKCCDPERADLDAVMMGMLENILRSIQMSPNYAICSTRFKFLILEKVCQHAKICWNRRRPFIATLPLPVAQRSISHVSAC